MWTASGPASAGCSRFVGRVGALAVALGVGVAVATGGTGAAWAEDGDGSGGGDTSNSDNSGNTAGDDNSDNSEDDGDDAGAERDTASTVAPNTTQAETQTKTPRRVLGPAWRHTGVRAPRIVLRAPGGAPSTGTTAKTTVTPDGAAASTTAPAATGTPARVPTVTDVVTQWTDRLTQAFTPTKPATGTGQTPPPASNPAGAGAPQSTAGTGPASSPVVARQNLSDATDLRSTADQVRALVASATATVGTDAGRVATALSGAADTLRDRGVDATIALRAQAATALTAQDTPNTAVAPVAQSPVAQIVSGLLAAIGITPGSAATTPVRPLAPQTLLGVLALIRREIEHTFFNKAPQFPTDTISLVTEQGAPKTINGLPATDSDGDPITYTAPAPGTTGAPANGTVTITKNAAGVSTVTYTPNPGYTGADTFTLTASDAGTGFHLHGLAGLFNPRGAHTDTVTVDVSVVNDNHAPIAAGDSYAVAEDGTLSTDGPGLLGNDADIDDDDLTAQLVDGPTKAADFVLNADGSFSYTPKPNTNGVDTFTYRAFDGQTTSALTIVTINVGAVNDVPVAAADLFSTPEDTTLTTGNVLANDRDAENDVLTAHLVTGPANGALDLDAGGSFTYAPDSNANGPDTFTYRVYDGKEYSNPVTVTVNVGAANDAPIAEADDFSTNEDTALTTGNVLTNDDDIDTDHDSLTAYVVDVPANAEKFTLNRDGSFTYTPKADFVGTDTFTYLAYDGEGVSDLATVTITVGAVNDAPTTDMDDFFADEDTTLMHGNVLDNDTDIDTPRGALTAQLVDGPTNADDFHLNADGTFTYTPKANFSGYDTFTYRAYDGQAFSDPTTVNIGVVNVNDLPTATSRPLTSDTASGEVTGAITVTDIDDDTFSYTVTGAPENGGRVYVDSEGHWTYYPSDADRAAAGLTTAPTFDDTHDTFTITVRDQRGGSVAVPVTVEVTPADNGYAGSVDVGIRPSSVVAAPGGRYVYVVSALDDAVKVVDTTNNTVVKTFEIDSPRDIEFSADGSRAYLMHDRGEIVVINTADYSTVRTYTVPGTTYANGFTVSPDGRNLYIDASGANPRIYVVDTTSWNVTTSYASLYNTGDRMRVSNDGRRLYVIGNTSTGNSIRTINLETGSISTVEIVSKGASEWGLLPFELSNDGRYLYLGRTYEPTPDSARIAEVEVYDTSSMTVVKTIPVYSATNPYHNRVDDIVITPAGDRIYISNPAGFGEVIDASDLSSISEVPAQGGDWAINAQGTHLYVAKTDTGSGSNLLRVISVRPPSNVV